MYLCIALNILQVESTLKLIDLDCAANFHRGDFAGSKFSSAYAPPELIYKAKNHQYGIRIYNPQHVVEPGSETGTSRVPVGAEDEAKQRGYWYLKADPAQDLWALGCILYLLCTGSTLFQATVQDNMSDESDLEVLYTWSSQTKKNKLSSVTDRHARHLISLLLTKEPCRRIPISEILNHPFLTRHVLHSSMKLHSCSSTHVVLDTNKKSVAVTSGVPAVRNDIYLCYRYGCDEDVVKKLYTALIDNGLTVCGGFGNGIDGNTLGHAIKMEDISCSLDGLRTSASPASTDNSPVGNLPSLSFSEDSLYQSITQGMLCSNNIVCFLSRSSVNHPQNDLNNFEKLTKTSPADDLLVQWKIALELKERGRIEGIFPVMIGDVIPGSQESPDDATNAIKYSKYFQSGCNPNIPNIIVDALEDKVREYLERSGLGCAYLDTVTVRSVQTQILSNQGGLIEGEIEQALSTVVKSISVMASRQKIEVRYARSVCIE